MARHAGAALSQGWEGEFSYRDTGDRGGVGDYCSVSIHRWSAAIVVPESSIQTESLRRLSFMPAACLSSGESRK
jgi:hypothetical protein